MGALDVVVVQVAVEVAPEFWRPTFARSLVPKFTALHAAMIEDTEFEDKETAIDPAVASPRLFNESGGEGAFDD